MFRIHWKGCPHRHLPRIRLRSWPSSLTRSRRAQDAAEAVNLLPFSPPLVKARQKQRIKARRKQYRPKTSSNETTVSIRAIQNIEVFGWDSPRHFDSLGGGNIQNSFRQQELFSSLKNYQVIESSPRLVEYSENRPRFDGARSSRVTNELPKSSIPRERKFTPIHWNKKREFAGDTSEPREFQRVSTVGKNRVSGAYLPHFTTTEPTRAAATPASRTRNQSTRIPGQRVPIRGVPIVNAPSRIRSCDPRLPVKKSNRQRVTKSSPASSRSPAHQRMSVIASSRSSKRRGWTSPEFKAALNSVLTSQGKLPGENRVSDSDFDPSEPSRTSSERRAIERFALELAQSLADPDKLRKSAPESSVPSIHTVEEIQPYAPQFRAAGLSVTFQDQVVNTPRLRQIHTPVKRSAKDIKYHLKTFSFERQKTGIIKMPTTSAKPHVWGTPTDSSSSAGSTWTEGHHHLRKAKGNNSQLNSSQPPNYPPPIPPRPVNSKMDRKAPIKPPPLHSPSEETSSSGSSFTEGYHHARTARTNAQPKLAKRPEVTPTRAPRRAPTSQFVPPTQSPKKSIPWLQKGEVSPKGKSVQDPNILSPETVTETESSDITVIDWSPIEDPRAKLAVYPLVARPTEVEWIEMNFEEGKKSMSGPSVRIVDMKRKSAWESADPATTVDIVPIQSSQETSAIIIPVNVVSITPVPSVYSVVSSKRWVPAKPLLCTRCGRLLVSPTPKSTSQKHDCKRSSSICENCVPSKVELPTSQKRASVVAESPSPNGSPPPPLIPVRSIRRTGTLFKEPPISATPSVVTFAENSGQADPKLNGDPPSVSKLETKSPKRTPSSPAVIPSRVSVDTIGDIISQYTSTESKPEIALAVTSPAIDQKPIRDKDIFRGLQVVTLAACDKNVDALIQDMSGTRIRKFLADMSEFQKMGLDELSRQARRAARKKKRELEKALQQNNETRPGQNDGINEASDGSGESTVKAWKGDGDKHKKTRIAFGPKTDFRVSVPDVEIERNEDLGRIAENSTHEKDMCESKSPRKTKKGKGKEQEMDGENVKSRRDRFGLRDGQFQ